MSAATPILMPLHARSSAPAEDGRSIATPLLATLALHAAVATLLWAGWEPSSTPPAAEKNSIRTQLVTLPVPTPVATVEPIAAPPPPAPEPPTPVADAPPPKPVIDEAAIARKRLAEQQERERQQQQRAALERERERAEQQRLAAQAAAEQQRLDALARQQAEAAAAAERAAAQRQYLPLSKPEPDYPRRALTQRLEGDCTVEYDVNANGRVDNPRLVSGACDNPLFARPSLAAAKDFIYQPRLVNGQPVAVSGVRNTFRYRLSQ